PGPQRLLGVAGDAVGQHPVVVEAVDVELDLQELTGADAGEGEREEHQQGVPLGHRLREGDLPAVLVGEGEVRRPLADSGHRRPTRRCTTHSPAPTGWAAVEVRPTALQESWTSA